MYDVFAHLKEDYYEEKEEDHPAPRGAARADQKGHKKVSPLWYHYGFTKTQQGG